MNGERPEAVVVVVPTLKVMLYTTDCRRKRRKKKKGKIKKGGIKTNKSEERKGKGREGNQKMKEESY